MYDTLLTCKAGSQDNPVFAQVEFSGTLTKAAASAAALRAFGHTSGVTVIDERDGTAYRFTASGGRKLKPRKEG